MANRCNMVQWYIYIWMKNGLFKWSKCIQLNLMGGGFKYFLFSLLLKGRWSNLTSISFKGVETTNQVGKPFFGKPFFSFTFLLWVGHAQFHFSYSWISNGYHLLSREWRFKRVCKNHVGLWQALWFLQGKETHFPRPFILGYPVVKCILCVYIPGISNDPRFWLEKTLVFGRVKNHQNGGQIGSRDMDVSENSGFPPKSSL